MINLGEMENWGGGGGGRYRMVKMALRLFNRVLFDCRQLVSDKVRGRD